MHVARGLNELLREQQDNEVPPGVRALAEQLLARYGSCVQAILFYGSCLRDRTDEGLVDLYVLVDRYRSLPCGWIERCLHRILRPTVYYLEIPFDGRAVRCKFSVLSLRDFQRATSMRWFHSYFWGRFAQRTALLYVRDEEIAQQVRAALAQAVLTLLIRVLPTLPAAFETRDLWQKALSLSYKAELRAERPQTILHLYDAATEYYEKVTHAAMAAVPFPCSTVTGPVADRYSVSVSIWKRHMSHLAWGLRRIEGKLHSALRLLKGLFTFRGGLDYVLWKIQRHSGITVEITPYVRRHPLLGAPALFWRLYRQGAFR